MAAPFKTVLIANRGAIACRIIRTLKRMGIRSVAVFSDADAGSLHVAQADEAVCIGPAPVAESYLNVAAILDAARKTGAEAIHPGYGFLSENVAFAEACAAAGLVFIGPAPDNMRAFAHKHTARALALAEGAPLALGTDLLRDIDQAISEAARIGYPVMLKATAGGGGIGMSVCADESALRASFEGVQRMARGAFGDAGVFLERFVAQARHVEVQIFGDGEGNAVALGERDCSLQRRNQKVVEETPAPNLSAKVREALIASAVRLAQGARYRSAGTVEYLYDPAREEFYFLEVNTRLQVEHGITEQVTGVDLVEWMIRGAAGDFSPMRGWKGGAHGAAIEARIYAEDPARNFLPSSGLVTDARFPADARVDTWIETGVRVSAFYDPMLAKLIVTAPDRPSAIAAMQRALDATHIAGLQTNVEWLRDVARSEAFVSGKVSTRALADVAHQPRGLRVLSGAPSASVQDYPGRLGYWAVGVPPNGPMDSLAFRLGNRLLGNAPGAAGIEFAALGPTIEFLEDTCFCLTGAEFGATLDGAPVATYACAKVKRGQVLKIGRVQGAGQRGYLLVRGGIDAPEYLGSRSTFTLGNFGGPSGAGLVAGEVLHLGDAFGAPPLNQAPRPELTKEWRLRVLLGPHSAPDFFTQEGIAEIASAEWRVHYNSSRTGVRLVGPKPHWARRDGGEAGLHPSNIHDNAYAIGAVDFTGDMPVLLGPDGPSLGGFVCPFTAIAADLWKIGQFAPGDRVRFEPVSEDAAREALADEDALIATLRGPPAKTSRTPAPSSPILAASEATKLRPRVTYRRQGDDNVLIEYGPIVLDLELRVRVHALMLALETRGLDGVIDVTPGIRSLQVHYDPRVLPQPKLMEALQEIEESLDGLDDFEVPSRVVWLPLSWKDPAIYETISKYVASVRDDAPWTPDNIEFIRRINGLSNIDDVQKIVFDARYLVMGLGDVYLGAPVATPVDPRHRLVTTKYNPARTWTPPNVVGIGGAYMCIYGMEGPGGYQLFGRTIQVWNTYRQTQDFTDGKPWLLRFFDQIRFFPVTAEELVEWRRDFPAGRRALKIEHETFKLADYRAFLKKNAASIGAFEKRREAAFAAEREDWERRGEFARVASLSEDTGQEESAEMVLPEGSEPIEAALGGSIWRVLKQEGERVEAGAPVAIVEAMKTECDVAAPISGVIRKVFVKEKQMIAAGAVLMAIEPV